MDNEKINVNVDKGVKELVLRHGKAEVLVPFRNKIIVNGNLDTAYNYLKNAPKWFSRLEEGEIDSPVNFSEIYVDRDSGEIKLVVDAGSEWESKYNGVLKVDEIFKLFKINTGYMFTTFALADLIKMNRSYFESKDAAMLLVSELRNFKGKVEKQVEDADDQRGNKRVLLAQAVETNIPKSFRLNIPLFKGYPKQDIEVEVSISASDLNCTLISPEANDIVSETKNQLIDEQLEKIKLLFKSIKTFEI